MRIDLSADVGELSQGSIAPVEAALLRSVTSVNIACGVHAGDPFVIRRLLRLAGDLGVRPGAHPSLPDRAGGGRRFMHVTASEVEDAVLYQLAAIAGIARTEGVPIAHVKPHGALYHMASRDRSMALAVVRAAALIDPALAVVGPPGSSLLEVAREKGLPTRSEAFADRAYGGDGGLVGRGQEGAMIDDPTRVIARSLRLVLEGRVVAADGITDLRIDAETLCIHGDTQGAAELAAAVRRALETAGVTVAAP